MQASFSFDGSLAVIGGGRMGEAIIAGLIAAGTVAPARITVAEPAEQRRTQLTETYGVACVADGVEALPADLVLLAVKPQIIDPVVQALAGTISEGSLVVSIAAGVSTARLESLLPAGIAVVRVMPNTPAMVGEGMAVISGGSDASVDQVGVVRGLFEAIGGAVVIDERYQDAATAISGCGPAYFALVVDALARAGVKQGLPRDVAQELAVKTMRGTALMISASGQHPEALIDAVTSPGGATIAAIDELERAGVRAAFSAAVTAAVNRSKELGS